MTSRRLVQSLQDWQSEFLAAGALAVPGIFLVPGARLFCGTVALSIRPHGQAWALPVSGRVLWRVEAGAGRPDLVLEAGRNEVATRGGGS